MKPTRQCTDGHGLPNERVIAAACLAAIATLAVITSYQLKVVDRLPDPPFPVFASESITSSKAAHPFGIPDGLLGLASYGTTFALIRMARRNKLYRTALGIKLVMDAGAAAFNAGRQVIRFGKLCSWCTGTALATGWMTFAGRKVVARALIDLRQSARPPLDRALHPCSERAALNAP